LKIRKLDTIVPNFDIQCWWASLALFKPSIASSNLASFFH